MRERAWTHPDAISELFNRDDPKRYEWVICGTNASFPVWRRVSRLIGPVLGVGLIIPALSFAAAAFSVGAITAVYSIATGIDVEQLMGTDESSATFKVRVGVAIILILLGFTIYLVCLMWWGPPKKKQQAQSHLDEVLTSSIGVIIFILPTLLASGFRGAMAPAGQWLLFFAQHAVNALSLDFAEVFGVHLTDIEPQTWYARLGVVFFRFLIVVGLLNFLWGVYQRRYKQETVAGTVQELFWKCEDMLDRDTLELQRKGEVVPFKCPERVVRVVDFVRGLDG
jgi:hypothetical protein